MTTIPIETSPYSGDLPGQLISVDELVDHMSGITLEDWQIEACKVILAGCQRGLERQLNRRFVSAEVTETVTGLEDGWAPLSRSPVQSIVSVAGGALDVFAPQSGVRTRNGIYVGAGITTTVTYVGGFSDLEHDDLADVRLAILEKVAGLVTTRHDDTLSVKALETRDDVETARKAAASWTDDEVLPFYELKRRVVV